MKNVFLILGLALLMFFSSCSTQYYVPALYSNDVMEMSKPHSHDAVKHAIYAQGNYFIAVSPGDAYLGSSYNNKGGIINVYGANTFNNFSVAYGVLGFTGGNTVSTDGSGPNTNGPKTVKNFYGYGFNASASYYTNSNNIDFHVIGADLVYTNELGDYANFRKQGGATSNIYLPQTNLFTYAVFTEVAIKKADTYMDIKYSLNFTPGNVSSTFNNQALTSMSLTFMPGYKRVHFIWKLSTGLANTGTGNGMQFGLNYRL